MRRHCALLKLVSGHCRTNRPSSRSISAVCNKQQGYFKALKGLYEMKAWKLSDGVKFVDSSMSIAAVARHCLFHGDFRIASGNVAVSRPPRATARAA